MGIIKAKEYQGRYCRVWLDKGVFYVGYVSIPDTKDNIAYVCMRNEIVEINIKDITEIEALTMVFTGDPKALAAAKPAEEYITIKVAKYAVAEFLSACICSKIYNVAATKEDSELVFRLSKSKLNELTYNVYGGVVENENSRN